jgi:uncharacterized protein with HEPN domain
MLEHARDGVQMIQGRDREEIHTNRLLQLALAHLVQIVGEAATQVSREGRDRHPEVPWARAIATRHRIVHAYVLVDYDVVWDTIEQDFPPLVAALERALSSPAD